jgi:hypothetical protein
VQINISLSLSPLSLPLPLSLSPCSSISLFQGFGEQAIFVLDRLSDEALRATNFQWFKASAPAEDEADEEAVDDEAELNLDKVEEDMAAEYSDEEDEDDILHINGKGSTTRCVFDVRFYVRQTVCRRDMPTNVACLCVKRFVGHKNANRKRTV